MSFWHYTCEHSQRKMGDTGMLLPLRQLVGADPLARHLSGFRAPLGHIIWLTDLDSPIADALGLTRNSLRCDRTAHRYRVVDYVPMHYPSVRRHLSKKLRDELETAPGAMPSHWYVAYTPVPVVYDPILSAVAS